MSPSVDTGLTVALFAIGGLVIVFFGAAGLFMTGTEQAAPLAEPTSRDKAVGLALDVVPPVLLFGPYLAALLLAFLRPGPTFYYPLIAVPIALAAWNFARSGLSARVNHMRAGRTTAQDVLRANAERIVIGDAAQAVAAVEAYLHRTGIDYLTTDLVADPFEGGWSVSAPAHIDSGNSKTFPTAFLIGPSGHIEQTSSSTPTELARQRFAEQERARAAGSGRGP